MDDAFNQLCAEQIRNYVYALLDPRRGGDVFERMFYIGKGVGNRCYEHAFAELKADELSDDQLKLSLIRDIRNATNKAPDVVIIAHDLKSNEAFRLEALLIALFAHRLTNAIKGKGDRDYWLPSAELDARYADPLMKAALTGTILLVSLNGQKGAVGNRDMSPYPLIKDDEAKLADRTLGMWPVSPEKAKNVDYVIGVYRGLTRCIFEIEKDVNGNARFSVRPPMKPGGKRRIKFVGKRVENNEWTLRRIVDKAGNTLTKFGPQSACRMLVDERD